MILRRQSLVLGSTVANITSSFTYSSVYNDASGTNYALTNAPECLQPTGGSTDCLFLNIWTTSLPGSSTSSLKPVMVYIYGGGFTTGSASSSTTDGGNLAARGDVVVINIAYRLGALGVLTFNDGGNSCVKGLVRLVLTLLPIAF